MVEASVRAMGDKAYLDPAVQARVGYFGRVFRWIVVVYCTVVGFSISTGVFSDALQQSGPFPWRHITPTLLTGLSVVALGALLTGENREVLRGRYHLQYIGVALSLLGSAYAAYVSSAVVFDRLPPWIDTPQAEPSFAGAFSVLLLGIAIYLNSSKSDTRVVVGQITSLLVFSMVAAILLAYLLGDASLGGLVAGPPLSLQGTFILLLLATGIFLLRPGSGLLSAAASPGQGGRLLRRYGPIALLVPSLMILVADSQAQDTRVNMLAIAGVALGLGLLIFLAIVMRTIDLTGVEAAASAAQAERATLGLEQQAPLVSEVAGLLHIVEIESESQIDVATRFRPAVGVVAGDTTAVRLLPNSDIGIVVIDVAGHGAGPAVEAVRTRDFVVAALAASASPAEALGLTNRFMSSSSLLSAFVATLNPTTGVGRAASAGHPPAIKTSFQSAELLWPTGPLVHLAESARYEELEMILEPGESLIVFSDGIADIQKERNGRTEIDELVEHLLSEGGNASRTAELALAFADPEPRDDQSVVVLRMSD